MCEIAVFDPEKAPIQTVQRIASQFHEEQGDGLGVLAVLNEGDSFDYRAYKSTDPHWQTLYSFLRRNYSRAWRVVVHGRNGTAGDVNRQNAHPIEVDCPECEFDYVVHNGSVRNHKKRRGRRTSDGHRFTTKVDSEVIPHTISELPETVSQHTRSTYKFRGNLNYLLFSEDGILVRVSQKYHLDDAFTMTCSMKKVTGDADPEDLGMGYGTTNEWMLITPDGEEPEIETKERVIYRSTRTSSSTTSASSTRYSGSACRWVDDRQDEDEGAISDSIVSGGPSQTGDDTYHVEYKDLVSYDHLHVIMVAPGVLRLIDTDKGEAKYIWRDKEPKLYYWYSMEPEPDNIDELAERANQNGDSDEANVPAERVAAAVKQEVTQTVADVVSLDDDESLRTLQNEVMDAAEVGTQAALSYQ